MYEMFLNSAKLFMKGKLFRDPMAVARQWAIGFVAALAVVVALRLAGVPLWLDVLVTAVSVGALQPWLFKDLKYN